MKTLISNIKPMSFLKWADIRLFLILILSIALFASITHANNTDDSSSDEIFGVAKEQSLVLQIEEIGNYEVLITNVTQKRKKEV